MDCSCYPACGGGKLKRPCAAVAPKLLAERKNYR